MNESLTKEEIDAYVAEYTLLVDKSENLRLFLNKKGLTNKDTSYHSYTNMPKKAQQLFHILYDIKYGKSKYHIPR